MRRVGLHLTDRCQLDCDHCLRDPGREPLDLAFATIEMVLVEASRSLGIARVSLTGGEPTLHPRFTDVLDLVVSLGMRWDMVSNGRRFDRVARWLEERPARRDACESVALSMDGASDSTHDAIRGSGQRREVLGAMAILVDLGVPFEVTAAVHARNAHEIPAIAEEAAALGASAVRFVMTQPTGTPLDAGLALSASAWREIRERIAALQGRAPIPVLTGVGWPEAHAETCAPLRGDTLHIDPRGRLTLCCQHAGLPAPAQDLTVVGSAERGLAPLLAPWAAARRDAAEAGALEGSWAAFRCNGCLARFGRPHWTDQGVSGTLAVRERWRGDVERSTLLGRSLKVLT